MEDLYKILGITEKAKKKEIKKAYYTKSKEYHPDKGGNPEKFNLISKAYKILVDDEKRKRYDNGELVDDILKANNDKSLSIIAKLLCEIRENVDPSNQNVIKILKGSVDQNIQQISLKINQLKTQKQRYETFLKKIKCKNKKDNFMIEIVNGQINVKNQNINLLEKDKIAFEKAKKLIKDFDYDVVGQIQIM